MGWLDNKIDTVDNPAAPTTPTRVIDTEFTPHASKWVQVAYSVQLAVDAGETSSVELRSDSASPPVTVRDQASLAVVGSGDTVTIKQTLRHLVPPGHKVKLVSAGTGVATLTAVQVEDIVS